MPCRLIHAPRPRPLPGLHAGFAGGRSYFTHGWKVDQIPSIYAKSVTYTRVYLPIDSIIEMDISFK